MLPLIYPEAVLALTVGCFISNLFSPFAVFDVTLGVGATLLAAICTRLIGKAIANSKKTLPLKIVLGGLFPVLFNAAIVPLIVFFGSAGTGEITVAAYFAMAWEVGLGEAVWVYAVGTPLILFCNRQLAKNNPFFAVTDQKMCKKGRRRKRKARKRRNKRLTNPFSMRYNMIAGRQDMRLPAYYTFLRRGEQ